ncbi:hypothetical protein [Burkholderia gladioli]|uniref:hypothetical protein n=1 Tax=Burkholderia gladioli TaxID=28095 RepID=UPI0018DFA06C|nr:hypothetical protein [Burkholderia gladioli]
MRRDTRGERQCFVVQVIVGPTLVTCRAGSLVGIDELAGQRQFQRLGRPPRGSGTTRANARDEAEAQEAFGEQRAPAGDPDIAHQGESKPAPIAAPLTAQTEAPPSPEATGDAVQAAVQAIANLGGAAFHQIAAALHVLTLRRCKMLSAERSRTQRTSFRRLAASARPTRLPSWRS